jgi:anti-sigma B factor antagonist
VLFELDRTSVAGRPALTVRGELDLASAPELAAAVDTELAATPQALVLDLSGTTFLDSSGARELVRVSRKAESAGVALHVLVPEKNRPVRLTIDLLELGAFVPLVAGAAEIPSAAGRDARP